MNYKSHFKFNKEERSGIFFLLLIIVLLQVGYYFYKSFASDKKNLLKIDTETQAQIDALKSKAAAKDSVGIFPFNPNFITDHKGYTLGMSVEEIDRLHVYRAQDKFANSAAEFQKVTGVSDSLLTAISPYFKFPDWTKKNNQFSVSSKNPHFSKRPVEEIRNLNSASAEELKSISGIGDKLSNRIIKFRDRLGGFLVPEQLYDVYGLDASVAERVLKQYKLLTTPEIKKINVNTASVTELVKLVYLRYATAQEIVAYRLENGSIKSFDELMSIEGFPSDKIDRIALYLSLKK